ncbi:MAG: CorA family divalent cation transporter [Proteobacteria bacterium]|nr:CorA family divalent cation transporter [Pseudomonadota bacterium]
MTQTRTREGAIRTQDVLYAVHFPDGGFRLLAVVGPGLDWGRQIYGEFQDPGKLPPDTALVLPARENVLALCLDRDGNQVLGLTGRLEKHLLERVKGVIEAGQRPAGLRLEIGGGEGDFSHLDCGLESADFSAQDGRMGELADHVLNEIVGRDRPLLKFSTIFLYPFKYFKPDRQLPAFGPWRKEAFEIEGDLRYQEYIYFHTYVRDLLYPRNTSADGSEKGVRYYSYRPGRVPEINGVFGLDYSHQDEGTANRRIRTLHYPLTHIGLHTFSNRIGILALQITQEADQDLRTAAFWRQCCRLPEFREKHLTARDALYFNQLARRIYQTFRAQKDMAELPEKVWLRLNGETADRVHEFQDDDFRFLGAAINKNSIIKDLIDEFITGRAGGQETHRDLLDDRLVVHSFWALAGSRPETRDAEDALDELFARFMYVDNPGAGYAYDRDFITGLMAPLTYNRWRNAGTRFGFTRYSDVCLGFGGFTVDELFPHFNSMYYQMTLVALYYRASLIDFSHQVAVASRELIEGPAQVIRRDRFIELKKEFMLFTNIYWFKELTNQDQGIELFDYYKRAFNFDEMYDQVKEEIDRADSYLEILQNNRYNDLTRKFTHGGALLGIMAIVTGYFGMNFNEIADRNGILNQFLSLLSKIRKESSIRINDNNQLGFKSLLSKIRKESSIRINDNNQLGFK